MGGHEVNELQQTLLEIFKWFHWFCQKNQLRYYMLGGTMLGAIRHKGFIPWDDDIDVGMPRSDYEKLIMLMANETDGRYILETPHTEATDYFYPFSKIYDTQTTLIENTRVRIKRGIYLDVFPLDGIGDSLRESKRNYRPVYWKYNLLLARVTGIRQGRSLLKNLSVAVARLIPSFILDNKKLLLDLDKTCQEYSFDQCAWVGNLLGAWRFKEVMPAAILGVPTLYEFEGHWFFGAEQAQEYLKALYGEWKQLPPKEKQITHHDFVMCDLHQSYLNAD